MTADKDLKTGKKQAQEFGEVTTSVDLIDKQIALIPKEVILDLSKTVLDPCTGDGRYLMRYLFFRLPVIRTADDLLQAISTLYGIELQPSNVIQARANLMEIAFVIAQQKDIQVSLFDIAYIVNRNIKQGDFLNDE